ncbi:hypothetical protein JL722_5799 [Aureococcus anophagefferens]|nr:hypothetical protein JL722_5799 [Aureococcus anophagefferens]
MAAWSSTLNKLAGLRDDMRRSLSVSSKPPALKVTNARYRFEHYCTAKHLWEGYDAAANDRIARAFAAAPAGGAVALEGVPFEVNVTTENTRLVRRCRLATVEGAAGVDADVVLEAGLEAVERDDGAFDGSLPAGRPFLEVGGRRVDVEDLAGADVVDVVLELVVAAPAPTPRPRSEPRVSRNAARTLMVATMNMGGANVDGDELHHWLRGGATRDGAPASLVVVGAQEAGSVGALEESVDAHLKDHARVDLDRTSAGRVGLCLLVYVARCEATRLVGAAKVDYANLGHLDRDPTAVFKGSLSARVAVDFCDGGAVFELAVAVAHLPAHEGKLLRRVEALGTLGARLAAEGGLFNGADAACFFGDLNFRLDPRLGADAVAAAADVALGGPPAPGGRPRSVKYSAADWRAIADYAHDAAALRPFDELRRVLDDVAAGAGAGGAAAGVDYVEKRLPAFTDRVLFAGALDLADYAAAPGVSTSDHKPTRAEFRRRGAGRAARVAAAAALYLRCASAALRLSAPRAHRSLAASGKIVPIAASYVACRRRAARAAPEDRDAVWDAQHAWAAERARRLVRDMGGFYLKVGQITGAAAQMMPEAWVDALAETMEANAPAPARVARRTTKRLDAARLDTCAKCAAAMARGDVAALVAAIEASGDYELANPSPAVWALVSYTYFDTRWTPLAGVNLYDVDRSLLARDGFVRNSPEAFPLIRIAFLFRGALARCGLDDESMVDAWEPSRSSARPPPAAPGARARAAYRRGSRRCKRAPPEAPPGDAAPLRRRARRTTRGLDFKAPGRRLTRLGYLTFAKMRQRQFQNA